MRSLLEACSKMKDRMEGYQGGLFMDMWEWEVLLGKNISYSRFPLPGCFFKCCTWVVSCWSVWRFLPMANTTDSWDFNRQDF